MAAGRRAPRGRARCRSGPCLARQSAALSGLA
jgi:hypothetical protein